MAGEIVEIPPRPASTLVVSGPLTMAEAPRWREALLAALEGGEGLRIDLATAGPWDLAGVQLLLAAIATGRSNGRAVRLARVPKVCATILDRAGLADVLAGSIDDPLD